MISHVLKEAVRFMIVANTKKRVDDTHDQIENRKDQIEVMKTKVSEQGITYDKLHNKMFTLVGLELALASVLSFNAFNAPAEHTIAENIFLYGAAASLIASLVIIFINYQAKREWASPMSELEIEKMDNSRSRLEALNILYNDYRETYNLRASVLNRKGSHLNASLYLFIISAIIVIVLNIGGN